MHFQTIKPNTSISLFVKSILLFEEPDKEKDTVLPFFADGYPGLMFQETDNGLFVYPQNKKMPLLFLYGQTIHPIELHIKGSYRLIVFQLFPFVLKSFFDVTAKDVNDDCYNLNQVANGTVTENALVKINTAEKRIACITDFLLDIFQNKKQLLDLTIRQAIQLILDNKGKISVTELCNALCITERTFERRFVKEVGILPKQFSQIIQFQQSLEQLTLKDFTKLTDIVYANGFSDQSHFIRVFKAFTGKTPKKFAAKKQ